MTPALMLEVAYYGIVHGSYEEAQQQLEKRFKFTINDDTVRKVVNVVGSFVFENNCKIADDVAEKFYSNKIKFDKNIDGTFYLEADGSMLNTREKREDGTTWREIKLVLAFTSDNLIRLTNAKCELCKKIGKREYIAFHGNIEDFRDHLIYLAFKNGYGKYKYSVFLGDGASWIRKARDDHFPDALLILDFFHLCENTGNYANFIFKDKEDLAKKTTDRWCNLLENGQWQLVLKELEPYKNIKLKEGIVNLPEYIYNNRDSINYPEYKKRDLFIGSGAIESANKKVIQSRLKLTGQRWSIQAINNVATLRAKQCSDLWNEVVTIFNEWLLNR